nr:serine/threonine-protein kinase [Kribbella sandramycini]
MLTLLGRGGAGEVWKAEDLVLDRQVAVKLLRSLDGDPMDAVARFRAEAQAAARLTHPNVVATYDVGAAGDHVFLVMELVSGPDLAQLMRTAGLPTAKLVADIATQGARALDAAHAAGIVHRDVKPANLLLAPDGTLKMTDFGIAKRSGNETTMGVLLGTASYISPEQVTGGSATSASDWYALGCVLYELLAGTPPFTGATVEQVMHQHLRAQPAPLLRTDVPPQLAALVMQLLAKNPADRPASAQEVTALLASPDHHQTQAIALPVSNNTQVLHLPPRVDETDEPDEPREERRRGFPFVKVIAAMAAVLAAGVGVALLKEGVATDPPAQAGGSPSVPAAKVSVPAKPKSTPTPTPTPTKKPTKKPSKTPSKTPSKPPENHNQYPAVVAQLRQLADEVRKSGNQNQWPGQGDQPRSNAPRLAGRDLDQAAGQLSRGEVNAARKNYSEAKQRLVEAQREGKWRPTAEVYLLFAQLDRSMPEGDGDEDGEE